jgi:hypothetical protein
MTEGVRLVSPTIMDNRCVRVLDVEPNVLFRLLVTMHRAPAQASGLPVDAQLVGWSFDQGRNLVRLLVHSATFPPVFPGIPVPPLRLTATTVSPAPVEAAPSGEEADLAE